MRMTLFVIAMAFVSSKAFAASGDKSSGCGPGWFVTDRMSFSATTTRATTNSYVTPFAMTSGTSGCAKHTFVDNNGSHVFIAQSTDQLRTDAAQGQGEYITALSKNLGCSNSQVLASHFQAHFDELFVPANNADAIYLSARQVCPN